MSLYILTLIRFGLQAIMQNRARISNMETESLVGACSDKTESRLSRSRDKLNEHVRSLQSLLLNES